LDIAWLKNTLTTRRLSAVSDGGKALPVKTFVSFAPPKFYLINILLRRLSELLQSTVCM